MGVVTSAQLVSEAVSDIYHNQHEAVFEYLKQDIKTLPMYTYINEILTLKNYKPGKVITAPVAI